MSLLIFGIAVLILVIFWCLIRSFIPAEQARIKPIVDVVALVIFLILVAVLFKFITLPFPLK